MPLICRAQITSPPLPRIWVVALAGVRGKNSQVGQIPLLKYASFLHLPAIFQGEKRRRVGLSRLAMQGLSARKRGEERSEGLFSRMTAGRGRRERGREGQNKSTVISILGGQASERAGS